MTTNCVAHPLAPSLLSLEQQTEEIYNVSWKTPLKRIDRGKMYPVMLNECVAVTDVSTSVVGTALLQSWRIDCQEPGLAGRSIGIEGIAASKADVLLRIKLNSDVTLQQVLTANAPAYLVPENQKWHAVTGQYSLLGIEHLLTGLDHVLFVIALTLLIGLQRKLIWVITSFTIGHSVTLSAAVLGYVSFPQSTAEILIALTIVFTFAGLANQSAGGYIRKWTTRVAFVFGLLHGLGFAGALTEVGLPHVDIPLALFAFNVGIEIGQLVLIGISLLCLLMVKSLNQIRLQKYFWLPVYTAGTLSGFWFWQRLLGL